MDATSQPHTRRSRFLKIGTLSLAFLVLGGAGGWATSVLLRPPADPTVASTFTLATVREGEVGASIALNAVAQWTPTKAGANQAAGVVTSVLVNPGDEIRQGTALYTVNLRPVVVAAGSVPAFRSIERGTAGADVAQLQAMLAATGIYHGTVDGRAGATTTAAVRVWQKSIGEQPSGVVDFGDIIFVPALPTRVALNTAVIARGSSVSGGEAAVSTLPAAPNFTLPVTTSQAGLVPTGTRVELTSPQGHKWETQATDQSQDPQTQTISINLVGIDDASPCADECGEIPVSGQSELSAEVVVVKTSGGLVVPSAALITDSNGRTAVVEASGQRVLVSVTASAKGMSVITGITKGAKVRVPGNTN